MSTIAPGRLFTVTDAASFVALSQQNWVIASEELFRRVHTYQNGNRPADPSRRRRVKAAKWPSESNDAAWEGNRAAENGGPDSIHSPGAPAKQFVAAGLRPEAWVLLRDAAAVAGHP